MLFTFHNNLLYFVADFAVFTGRKEYDSSWHLLKYATEQLRADPRQASRQKKQRYLQAMYTIDSLDCVQRQFCPGKYYAR